MPTSPAVMALKDLHLEGNIVPMEWFKHLKYDSGKPDLNAIMILSDIVYWYRPLQVRDERSGQVIGYRQKFKHDLLQKSYQSYVDLLGISKGQVTDAFVRLEHQDLIRRVFRHVETSTGTLPNVLFIELNPQKVREISQLSRDLPIDPDISPDESGDIPGSIRTYLPIDPETNTEITTKTTTETLPRACVAQEMIGIWNQTFQDQSPVSLTSFRKTKLPLVLFTFFENDLNQWREFCKTIQSCSFLQGKGPRGWRASLDWCMEEVNLHKIREGQYKDKESLESSKAPSVEVSLQKAQDHINELSDPRHQQVAKELCKLLGPSTYLSWFQGMSLICLEGKRLQIMFPTKFIRDYVDVNYRSTLEQMIQKLYPEYLYLEPGVTGQDRSLWSTEVPTSTNIATVSIMKDLAKQFTQQESKPLDSTSPFNSERSPS